MTIRQQMASAVDAANIDLTHLTTVARARGTRAIRRRRATTIGAAAAVALIGVGATALVSQGPRGNAADSRPGFAESPGSPDLAATVPATGPGAAAALRYAVENTTNGTSSNYISQGPYGAEFNLTGGFAFTSTVTGVTSFVQVSITTFNDVPAGSLCGSMARRCQQSSLPDGSVLVTSQDALASDPGALNRSAVLWRPDGIAVTVSGNTGQDITGHETWGRLSENPAFSFQQLTDIAAEPWWGTTLPATFVNEGDSLDVNVVDDFN